MYSILNNVYLITKKESTEKKAFEIIMNEKRLSQSPKITGLSK